MMVPAPTPTPTPKNKSAARFPEAVAYPCPHESCDAAFDPTSLALATPLACPACGGFVVRRPGQPALMPLGGYTPGCVTQAELPAEPAGRAYQTLDLAGATFAAGLDLSGVVAQALDLSGATIEGDLVLSDLTLAGDLSLANARLAGQLVIRDAYVGGAFTLTALAVAGRTDVWNTTFHGSTNALGARFTGFGHFRQCLFGRDAFFSDVQFSAEGNFSYSRFAGAADFSGADFGDGAEFFESRFARDAEFTDVTIKAWADFTGASFDGPTTFQKARFGSGCEFATCPFAATADFTDVSFGGDAVFRDARFAGEADFDRIAVTGAADFRAVRFLAPVDLSASRFRAVAYFQRVRFDAATILTGAVFEAGWTLASASFQAGEPQNRHAPARSDGSGTPVDAERLTVRGRLDLSRARFGAPWFAAGLRASRLTATRAHFAGWVVLREAELEHASFAGAHCERALELDGARLGTLDFKGARLAGTLSLADATVATLSLTGGEFGGNTRAKRLTVTTLLDAAEARFSEKLDLTGAQLKGELRLSGLRAAPFFIAREQVEGRVRSAATEDWAQAVHDYGCIKASFEAQNLYADRDWAHAWQQRARRKARWARTYERVARRARGPLGGRLWVLKERSLLYLERVFMDWVSGYGTRPWRILLWMIGVALFFASLFMTLPGAFLREGELQPHLRFAEAFYFSFANLLVIGLENLYPRVHGGLALLVIGEAFVGLVLATLFVSTLSRKLIQ